MHTTSARSSSYPGSKYSSMHVPKSFFKGKYIVYKTSRILGSLLRQLSVELIPWNIQSPAFCSGCPGRLGCVVSVHSRGSDSGETGALWFCSQRKASLCCALLGIRLGHCVEGVCSYLCPWNWTKAGQFSPCLLSLCSFSQSLGGLYSVLRRHLRLHPSEGQLCSYVLPHEYRHTAFSPG